MLFRMIQYRAINSMFTQDIIFYICAKFEALSSCEEYVKNMHVNTSTMFLYTVF